MKKSGFAAIDHKILIMIDNCVSYNKWIFWNKFPNLQGKKIAQV